MGKWYHYCDVEYEDEDQQDENGKPKVVTCSVVSDEEAYIEYHRETVHEVGKSSVQCPYCNDPQMSNRRSELHQKVCSEGPTDAGEPTKFCQEDDCDYGCRGAATLRTHYQTYHPEVVGLAKPKRWSCGKCGKIFKSPGGYKQHTCPRKKKTKKGQSKSSSKTSKSKNISFFIFVYQQKYNLGNKVCNRLYECMHVYKELEMQSVHFWSNAVSA